MGSGEIGFRSVDTAVRDDGVLEGLVRNEEQKGESDGVHACRAVEAGCVDLRSRLHDVK